MKVRSMFLRGFDLSCARFCSFVRVLPMSMSFPLTGAVERDAPEGRVWSGGALELQGVVIHHADRPWLGGGHQYNHHNSSQPQGMHRTSSLSSMLTCHRIHHVLLCLLPCLLQPGYILVPMRHEQSSFVEFYLDLSDVLRYRVLFLLVMRDFMVPPFSSSPPARQEYPTLSRQDRNWSTGSTENLGNAR